MSLVLIFNPWMTVVCWADKAMLWLQNVQELTLVHYEIVEQKHTMLWPVADALVRHHPPPPPPPPPPPMFSLQTIPGNLASVSQWQADRQAVSLTQGLLNPSNWGKLTVDSWTFSFFWTKILRCVYRASNFLQDWMIPQLALEPSLSLFLFFFFGVKCWDSRTEHPSYYKTGWLEENCI